MSGMAAETDSIDNTDSLRTLNALRHLVRIITGASRVVEASTGITGAQIFVLRVLAAQTDPISLNDLAALTLTHQSTASAVVSRLVDQGFASRVRSPDDARRVELSITAAGRELLEKAPPTVQETLFRGMSGLSAGQRHSLANALEDLLASTGIEVGAAPMFYEGDVVEGSDRQ